MTRIQKNNTSRIKLKKGDFFLSRNPMMLGRVINLNQKFWSKDNKSKYSHAGIILDEYGTTLESLWTVKSQNLFEGYKDTEILIARHDQMNVETFKKGYDGIKHHIGQWYPGYRLPLMIFPPLAKYIHFGRVVCSELDYKFGTKAGLFNHKWYGKTPDDVHDMIKYERDWNIIFEGKV